MKIDLLNEAEKNIADKFLELKRQAGSHSPSIFTFLQKLPEVKIEVDACFLSNPLATDLFLEYLNREIVATGKLRALLEFYPSQNSVLAELLANYLKVDPQTIFIGNGAIEIIQAVLQRFVKDKILINIPTFSSYYEFVNPDTTIIYNNLKKSDNYKLDVDDFIQKVKEHQPDTIVIINPNNPDGGYISQHELEKIVSSLPFVSNIIIDESFIHFAYEDNSLTQIDSANLVNNYDNVIIIKSMSKDFGIAGIRAGYAIMNKAKVSALLSNGYLWNSNGLSEYFFRLYTDNNFYTKYDIVRKQYIEDTIEFIKKLSALQFFKTLPSKANFVLVEMPEGLSADCLVTVLLIKYGIYVRTATDKIGLEGNYVRIASRSKSENEKIVAALIDIESKLK